MGNISLGQTSHLNLEKVGIDLVFFQDFFEGEGQNLLLSKFLLLC